MPTGWLFRLIGCRVWLPFSGCRGVKGMLTGRVLFWITSGIAGVALLLAIYDAALTGGNETRQTDLVQRANLISAMSERRQNLPLIRDLLIAAQKEPNEKIRALLTKYGIPFTPPPAAAAQSAPAPSAPTAKAK